MLILPPGHAQTLKGMRRLTVREKWLIRGVLAIVIALVVGVVISLGTAGSTSAHGCIHLTIPAPTGAGAINQCGATAHETCSTALQPGGFTPDARRDVVAACRQAGLPVG